MMALQQAADILKAPMHGHNTEFTSVSTDTRNIQPGDLYLALHGERFDGHDFIEQAQRAGASAAIVHKDIKTSLPYIKVEDTRLALGKLAAARRQTFHAPVVAVTGSNGKTTVKEMIAAILGTQGEVLATQGNFNNDIGLPITLLRMQQEDYAVIEMGANHAGEIAYLTQITQPDIALITNAGPAHLEGFGSIRGVAEAKGEIYSGLTSTGIAIINLDDDYSEYWQSLCEDKQVMSFSMSNREASVYGEWRAIDTGIELVVSIKGECFTVRMQLYGIHNAMNALTAITVAEALQIPHEKIIDALNDFTPVSGRLKLHHVTASRIVIDDTYNANPASLSAAIEVLKQLPGEHWLVLGDMGELAGDGIRQHFDAGIQARESGISRLLAVGDISKHAVDAFGEGASYFTGKDELIAFVNQCKSDKVSILVKGSRFMHMEDIVNSLTGEDC